MELKARAKTLQTYFSIETRWIQCNQFINLSGPISRYLSSWNLFQQEVVSTEPLYLCSVETAPVPYILSIP